MKNLILTSNGLCNETINNEFLNMLIVPVNTLRCLFIPTAAITKKSQELIPYYFNQLLDLGIQSGNITTYNCDRYINDEEIKSYNFVYVCDGDPSYLMKQINNINIQESLKKAIESVIYIGIGAGSQIVSETIGNKKGLGFIPSTIECHIEEKEFEGSIFNKDVIIKLTDDQALIVTGRKFYVV